MDPLSEICASLHVQDAMYTRVEATAPWGLAAPGERGVKFVLLVRGSCILTMPTLDAPVALRGGDVFITLDDTPYEIYDEPSSVLLDCAEVMAAMVDNTIVIGGNGAPSTFISGVFKLDTAYAAPLLSVLPSFLWLPAGEDRSSAFEAILGMLARETSRRAIGFESMIGRLFEILFIHAVRAYCEQQQAQVTGWLAVVADPNLGNAARAMHDDLGKDWTLEALARIAGMSRTAFAARFKEKAGKTALDYLTYWRMFKAAKLIQQGTRSLAQIATDVGYQSEAAFNRMFAREIGITPGRFRKSPELAAGGRLRNPWSSPRSNGDPGSTITG